METTKNFPEKFMSGTIFWPSVFLSLYNDKKFTMINSLVCRPGGILRVSPYRNSCRAIRTVKISDHYNRYTHSHIKL